MSSWKSVAVTHTGKVRKINEDAFINREKDGFWAVADGMGGHSAGDYASQQIVMRLSQLDLSLDKIHQVLDSIDDALIELDAQLKEYAKIHQVSAVGSTVASLFLKQNQIGVVHWVGDSRVYLLRNGKLSCLTNDHSLVQELIDAGELSKAQAEFFPSKNIITRAIGANNQVCPELALIDYQDKDIFLLCSDGLINELSDTEIEQILTNNGLNLQQKMDKIISETLSKSAADNVTAILVKVSV